MVLFASNRPTRVFHSEFFTIKKVELSGSTTRMCLWRRCDVLDSNNGAATALLLRLREQFAKALDGLKANAIVQGC
jgi:hypothetical protein